MGTYTHTISKSNPAEFSLLYRTSGKWTNYSRLWDNDIESAPTNMTGTNVHINIKIDMSWLPSNMKLTKVNYGIAYKRTSQSIRNIWLRSSN